MIPNHADMTDVERTILHEAVAHKGLRELFGEKFGTFLDNVYRNAEEHIKQTIDNLVSDKGMSRHEATEEYMAGLAEDTNFEQVKHTTWWAKVKSWFADMLHKLGFENFVTAEKIGNNELRYVLWRSYENLKSGGLHGIFAKAEDIAKQQKLKVGDYAEEAVRYRDGEETGQDGEPVKPQGEAEEENFLKDYNAGDATFEEAITEGLLSVAGKHKEDIKARVQATEAIGGQLSKLNKAMRVQKKYDKATVDHIIRLARTILTNGGLDKLTHGEVKRLLSYVNKSVGKEAITTQARQVLDLLTEHQLKVCRESLNQLLRIKGKKVNQQGVEVQAGLDVKGQRMLETARAGIALDIDTLEQRMAEAQEKMGSDLAVEAENASIDYEGLMIARRYHELIKDSKEEKASVFGDSAELHFKTVDAAVKFDDWLRTGRIEKQQSADELRNDTAAKQLATNGFKVGDKVMYKGEPATIYEIDRGKPVLDTGLAPVMYELGRWEDVTPIKEKPLETKDKDFKEVDNKNGDTNLSDHIAEKEQLAKSSHSLEDYLQERAKENALGFFEERKKEDEDTLYRDDDSSSMRSVSSGNDDKLAVTTLPASTELPITEVSKSGTSVEKAVQAISELPQKVETLDGVQLNISRATRNKLKNELSKHKDNMDVVAAFSNLEDVVSNSILIEEHRDRIKVNGERKAENPSDANIEKTQRFYGAVSINGKPYRVKSTAIVFKQGNNKMHSYEITKIELLSSSIPTINSQATAPNNNSITLANLLKDVEFSYEKGRKLLDEARLFHLKCLG